MVTCTVDREGTWIGVMRAGQLQFGKVGQVARDLELPRKRRGEAVGAGEAGKGSAPVDMGQRTSFPTSGPNMKRGSLGSRSVSTIRKPSAPGRSFHHAHPKCCTC